MIEQPAVFILWRLWHLRSEFVYPIAGCGGWSVTGWTSASWGRRRMDSDSSVRQSHYTYAIDLTDASIKSRTARLTHSLLTHTSTPESESEKKARFRNPWFVTFLKNPDKPSHTPAVPHLSPSSHSQTPTQLPAQLSTQYKALLVFCDSIWLSTQAVSRQLCIIVCLWTAGCVQAELNQWHLLGWIYRLCFSLFKRLMTRPRWNLRTDFGQNLQNGIKYKRS